MTIPFFKYHGTGNDFVVIDQRTNQYINEHDQSLIEQMCDRRFGIGADGLMLIQNKKGVDFEMIYFNADGRTSSMCGNGGRCIVSLASRLGIFEKDCTFEAIDGIHEANITEKGLVSLKMNDVLSADIDAGTYVLDTGSPHYVQFLDQLKDVDMVLEGKAIRYSDRFKKEGINVNLAEYSDGVLSVRTYERGVEAETYSCGTGVVASAIAHTIEKDLAASEVVLETLGGQLMVSFERTGMSFQNIWLTGPAKLVYEGVYTK